MFTIKTCSIFAFCRLLPLTVMWINFGVKCSALRVLLNQMQALVLCKNATCFYSEHSSSYFNIECEPTILVDV
jgi:hypothetical protein